MKMRVLQMWIDAAVKRRMGKTRKAIKATDRRLNKTAICLHDVTLNCEANTGTLDEHGEQLQSLSDTIVAQDSPLPRAAMVVEQEVESDEHDPGWIRVLQGKVNNHAQQIEGYRDSCIEGDQALAKQNAQLRGQLTSLAGTVDELARWKAQVDQAARCGKGGVPAANDATARAYGERITSLEKATSQDRYNEKISDHEDRLRELYAARIASTEDGTKTPA